MEEQSPKPASTPQGAVFLSYASQDAEAARTICDALRGAGIEVWLDQSELRGGDAWDRKIRDQIRHCTLFIPVISAHSQARLEGYFRREWKFAVERKRDIADELVFLLPVVIDETSERGASVPEGFHEVQWTRLPGGVTSQEFIQHVSGLLAGYQDSPVAAAPTHHPSPAPASTRPAAECRSSSPRRMWLLLIAGAAAFIVAYIGIDRYALHGGTPSIASSAPAQADKSIAGAAPAATFAPPPHSIAVLPFVNMSGDKEQEYFSDGLTEELLNSLTRINELQVAARTSSFSFQGEHPDIATVAHKLNVGAVLEGSVRRSAHTVRITAQLVNGVTGFHLWSETYDRDIGDVLKLQTDIATAVANALKVTLLGNEAQKIEVGGTHNPAAFDAYLRGSKAYLARHDQQDLDTAIVAYTEAIRLDPNYARAFIARSLTTLTKGNFAGLYIKDLESARADAQKAIVLAPELGEGHAALAETFVDSLDFEHASNEYERAVTLAPGSAQVLRDYGNFVAAMGRFDAGVTAARRAVLLDPLNRDSHTALWIVLYHARRFDEAKVAFQNEQAIDPNYVEPYGWTINFSLGNLQESRAMCEKTAGNWGSQVCLAIVYDRVGRHADAEAQLAKFRSASPAADDFYQYAEIYAQWGQISKALEQLESAMHSKEVQQALAFLKVDPLLDPLRKEPRFQAIERELKFPE
jgi:TolB-like protein/Flp pilus assembly protein TadD